MTISIDQIKKLRELTGAPVLECRQALEENGGDEQKAVEWLRQKGMDRAEKKGSREIKAGLIDAYIHGGGKVGVLLEIGCETDFVARTDDFKNLSHELCLQIASMNPENVEKLLEQEYVRDPEKKIGDLVKETIGKLGENIVIGRFDRFELGK